MRQIPRSKLMGIVHSLWVSKLRYGLQLCIKARTSETDSTSACLKSLQLTQNTMLRAINGSKIKDKVSTKSMLIKFDLLSVNQLAAKIKLIEVWKSVQKEGYSLSLEPYRPKSTINGHDLRDQKNRTFNYSCKHSKSMQLSYRMEHHL